MSYHYDDPSNPPQEGVWCSKCEHWEDDCRCPAEDDAPEAVKIDSAQLEVIVADVFVTEASSLGWAPGFWPRRFEMDGRIFVRQTGDSGSFLYQQSGGNVLIEVFND
jgi:hypothetical protein